MIQSQLETVPGGTYHADAVPADAELPYKTYQLSRQNLADIARRADIDLCIDVWDIGPDRKRVDEIADAVEGLFCGVNLPQSTILPTIYGDSRYPVAEKDTNIKHEQLHFAVQQYTNDKED